MHGRKQDIDALVEVDESHEQDLVGAAGFRLPGHIELRVHPYWYYLGSYGVPGERRMLARTEELTGHHHCGGPSGGHGLRSTHSASARANRSRGHAR